MNPTVTTKDDFEKTLSELLAAQKIIFVAADYAGVYVPQDPLPGAHPCTVAGLLTKGFRWTVLFRAGHMLVQVETDLPPKTALFSGEAAKIVAGNCVRELEKYGFGSRKTSAAREQVSTMKVKTPEPIDMNDEQAVKARLAELESLARECYMAVWDMQCKTPFTKVRHALAAAGFGPPDPQ